MEALVLYVLKLAETYPWVHYVVMGIGLAYLILTALRAFLTLVVKLTKTNKDDKIVKNVFAFLDKYAWGFGKLSEYYETHKKVEDKKEEEKK